MVRYLPLANGRLKVSFDRNHRIADFYFSEFATENHAGGSTFRHGISVNGDFRWVDSDIIRNMTYFDHTLVGNVVYEVDGLTVENFDAVDIYKDIYLRKVKISNRTDQRKEVRFFYHQNFNIRGSDIGDTAQYVPELLGVMHYKADAYFLASVLDQFGNSIDQYATGVEKFDGKEGTWKDAEDSELSMNPVSIGSVDSVVRYSLTVEPGGESEFFYFILCADQMKNLSELRKNISYTDLEKSLARTSNYWRLWSSKKQLAMDEAANSLYTSSLLILRTHANDIGAIVASCDSDVQGFNKDGYYYVWPRDSSFAAYSMARAGHSTPARAFFTFCGNAITDEGYLQHKYRADGAPASTWLPHVINGVPILPVQEDETSLVLWALKKYFEEYRDVEFISSIYEKLIRKAADFVVAFTGENGLPKESFDLWEERYGVHAYTVATSYAALKAAAYFADVFGDVEMAVVYNNQAERMSEAFERLFYSEEKGYYARAIIGGVPDFTVDSSLTSLYNFGFRDHRNPRVKATVQQIENRLWVGQSGGIARYENDPYQRRSFSSDTPGNPWIITTLWVADYHIKTGDLPKARKYIDWVISTRNSTGVLPEQVNPLDLSHISASPLVWSHAQFIITLMDYKEALETKSGQQVRADPLPLRS